MARIVLALACLLVSVGLSASDGKEASLPSIDYDTARKHEIKPHRRTIPHEGVRPGFNQLHLTLTVSPTGDVVNANANGNEDIMMFWPQLQDEVYQWKFTPFEHDGVAVTAEVEEYIDLVPPERLPRHHVAAPVIRNDSRVIVSLQRTGCYGTCPAYKVTLGSDGIVTFEGRAYVAASGKHTAAIDPDAVRKLGRRFVAADFYSMDARYTAAVTDSATYVLSVAIDGHSKNVIDYVGEWQGMPAVISELEDETDKVAQTQRWIDGNSGLVSSLEAEDFNFHSFPAQVILKEAARRGETETVRGLLTAGVSLEPLPAQKPKQPYMAVPFEGVGWLNAASGHPETLQVLLDAGASRNDQKDKDLALVGAARSGSLEGVRALIAYGANPNADLGKEEVAKQEGGMTIGEQGAGSILIYAAGSGNPEVVREILRYHPNVEARDRDGKTAMFAAVDYGSSDEDGARVECVRLLAQAGANVNARDKDGNTPLHETFLTDVEEELLRLGADVNARNDDGETPIFTTVDDEAIPLFIEHGADLNLRNNKGETVLQAAEHKGPQRQKALQDAMQKISQQ